MSSNTSTKWSYTHNGDSELCKIHKLYYAYSLDITPPVHILFAQLRDGSMVKFSSLKESEYPFDTEAFEAARGRPHEIPVPVPEPPKKDRGDSCSIN